MRLLKRDGEAPDLHRYLLWRLMTGRTQQYLRYLHLREAVARIGGEIETVCVVGAGRGIAELAIALEFPHLRWTLTDIIFPGSPCYHRAMELAWKHGIDNVGFSVWDAMQPTARHFDLVCSTEMLEHVPNPIPAARNMRAAARKYVYCLVPFGDAAANADPRKRRYAWDNRQHFVFGYDSDALESMFGTGGTVAGTYWNTAGAALREALTAMSDDQITAELDRLIVMAAEDLRDEVPRSFRDAAGIKILVRADAPLPPRLRLPPTLATVVPELAGATATPIH